MKYLLDTNTCIRYLNGRSPSVFRRLDAMAESDICVCSVVKFELRYGALRSKNVAKAIDEQQTFLDRFTSLAFDDAAQSVAARIRADLSRTGTPIGPYDLLIAAIALANNLILVTHNTRELSRISDLRLDDWETDVPPPALP